MRKYKAMRISVNGVPTYGDKYITVESDKELQYNEIIDYYNARVIILFEMWGSNNVFYRNDFVYLFCVGCYRW